MKMHRLDHEEVTAKELIMNKPSRNDKDKMAQTVSIKNRFNS